MRMLLAGIFPSRELRKLLRILPTVKHRLAASNAAAGRAADTAMDRGPFIDPALHAAVWVEVEAEAKRLIVEDHAASAITLKARRHSADRLCFNHVAEALRNDLVDPPCGVVTHPPDEATALRLALFVAVIGRFGGEKTLGTAEGEQTVSRLRAAMGALRVPGD